MFWGLHYWLPVMFPLQCLISVLVTYKIAVDNDHAVAIWPYISETGAQAPEKNLFILLMNICAVLAGMNVYIRYCHVEWFLHHNIVGNGWRYSNSVTAVVGACMSVGFSVVACYSYLEALTIHNVGACMAFGFGFLYTILQTIFSRQTLVHKMAGINNGIMLFRILLCVAMFISLIIYICYGVQILSNQWTDDLRSTKTSSAIGQWCAGLFLVTYFGTFFTEFKEFRINSQILLPSSGSSGFPNENQVHGISASERSSSSAVNEYDSGAVYTNL